MKAKQHIIGFLIFSLASFYFLKNFIDNFEGVNLLIFFVSGLFFSLFPDIDAEQSKIKRFLERIFDSAIIIFLILYIINKEMVYLYAIFIIVLIHLFLSFAKHGGIFHSIIFTIFVSIIVSYLNLFLGLGALVGWGSHLFLDKLF